MNFSFTPVNRGRTLGGDPHPVDVLRINKKSISIGEHAASRFNETRYLTEAKLPRLRLGLAFDVYNQAIKVSDNSDGFTFSVNDSGTIYSAIPVELRRSGLPVGDYKLVDGTTDVFQLAR